eukprot:21592-Eustigmatos_ZCMA.PRE.1
MEQQQLLYPRIPQLGLGVSHGSELWKSADEQHSAGRVRGEPAQMAVASATHGGREGDEYYELWVEDVDDGDPLP